MEEIECTVTVISANGTIEMNMGVIRPKLLALDSSQLSDIARERRGELGQSRTRDGFHGCA